jgi:alpha/beta hydrolase family protein
MLRRACLLFVYLSAVASATLLRIEVAERSDVLEGRSFGKSGPYERIIGKAYFGVDPNHAANRIITDVDKAPRNAEGLVEFSSDIYVLKPRDPQFGNGAVLYEVSNRGRKGMLSMFNRATASLDPRAPRDFGDDFVLEQGYTLVWLGWQFDVPSDPQLVRLYTPVVKGITGLVRSEIIVDHKETSHSLADRNHIAYPVMNPDDPKLTLTVRDRREGARQPVPRSQWRIQDRTSLVLPAGFEPGRIYELVYTSQDPAVVGLGPAAVRDLIAFLKFGGAETMLADQRRYLKRAYGVGTSQSGRFLRTFLYYGFNADEKGRKVFDGVMAHVAGAGRGSFNHRFAQPSRDGHPFLNLFYPTDIFPFTDIVQKDPETGISDGLLERAEKAGVAPKIFYTNSSYEYWGRSAGLIHTTIDGKADAPIPDHTRIYFFAGGQHGPGAFPPARNGTQNPANPNPYTWSMRALLVAMNEWVKDAKEPPPSLYPRVSEDRLVSPGALQFPKIPGVEVPTRPQRAYRADYGAEFRSAGIDSVEPPKIGTAFPILVPQVDQDGNETAGIRMPDLQIPLATFAGWNLRAKDIGAPDEMFSMVGSWIPFARTKAEREQKHDPRPSVEERYSGRAEYLAKVAAAARMLADRGYLLDRDVAPVVAYSAAEWDYVTR